MYCSKCSRKIDDTAEKCPYCGAVVSSSDIAKEMAYQESRFDKGTVGFVSGLLFNILGLIGLIPINQKNKQNKDKKIDKNGYLRSNIIGSILQIIIILLVVLLVK